MVTIRKQANGDMLQYFADHPKKLKEKEIHPLPEGRGLLAKQDKQAYLEEIYNAAFDDEIEKISSILSETLKKQIVSGRKIIGSNKNKIRIPWDSGLIERRRENILNVIKANRKYQ